MSSSKSILLPLSLGLNYQHHPDLYGIVELLPCSETDHDLPTDSKAAEIVQISSSSFDPITGIYSTENALCLINIPDIFVPKDILHYFQHSLESILLLRVYRHFLNQDEYVLFFFFDNQGEKNRFLRQYQGKIISSLYDLQCCFYEISGLSVQTFYEYLPLYSCNQLFSILYNHEQSSSELMQLLSSNALSSNISPPVNSRALSNRSISATPVSIVGQQSAPSPHSMVSEPFPSQLHRKSPHFSLESSVRPPSPPHSPAIPRKKSSEVSSYKLPESCPLCLELFQYDSPGVVILFCSHQFHLSCLTKVEGIQCPICRFEHNNLKAHLTSCFICGFPHSPQQSSSSSLPFPDPFASASKQLPRPDDEEDEAELSSPPHLSHRLQQQEDVWLCLVCGFTGCGWQHQNHIEQHYQETLHTYALNIHHPSKVWDFAGNGFVHRLILERSEEGEEGAVPDTKTKVAEVSREGAGNLPGMMGMGSLGEEAGDYRSLMPPLDESDQQAMVQQKVDRLLGQYQQILVWRLTQNRLFYEDKLRQVWQSVQVSHPLGTPDEKEHKLEEKTAGSGGEEAAASSSSLLWTRHLRASLAHEQSRLLKQCESTKEAIHRLRHEEEIAREFHKHLQLNRGEWEERVVRARQRLRETEELYRREIPRLQEQVSLLMLKLEGPQQTPPAPSSSQGGEEKERGGKKG